MKGGSLVFNWHNWLLKARPLDTHQNCWALKSVTGGAGGDAAPSQGSRATTGPKNGAQRGAEGQAEAWGSRSAASVIPKTSKGGRAGSSQMLELTNTTASGGAPSLRCQPPTENLQRRSTEARGVE